MEKSDQCARIAIDRETEYSYSLAEPHIPFPSSRKSPVGGSSTPSRLQWIKRSLLPRHTIAGRLKALGYARSDISLHCCGCSALTGRPSQSEGSILDTFSGGGSSSETAALSLIYTRLMLLRSNGLPTPVCSNDLDSSFVSRSIANSQGQHSSPYSIQLACCATRSTYCKNKPWE